MAADQWEYIGDYKAEKIEYDEHLIAKHSIRFRQIYIWVILYLVPQIKFLFFGFIQVGRVYEDSKIFS